ncbi:MAG: tRNA threonylcarbamoyladenosine dehydratase [Clostridiales bacterium]|nr:tRNA threonylcarbamoyladenosine dehydratase [Clostridiales bacterium]
MDEFQRTEMLIGKDNLEEIENSKVAIFGVGGVGSYVAEALARAGIGHFVLVDNDIVSITNINRQLIALHSTLDRAKVDVMRERIYDINPNAEVNVSQEFYDGESLEKLIGSECDYVVDAIDSVPSKIKLIVAADALNVPVISSMGAGNKLDPTMFRVSDIYKTSVCPLARVMRKRLRQEGISRLKVVYSQEEPIRKCEGKVPASISFVPSVVGLIIASEVVRDIIKGDDILCRTWQ